jgi:hypothetical protein
MRRIILSLCALFVLAWAAGSVLAQGQGKGKEQGSGPADRAVKANTPGDIAKPDPNASAANAKKSLTSQDTQKNAEERAKAFKGRGQEQIQTQQKAVKDQVGGKMAETKAKGQEQRAQVFEKMAQHEMAKHLERQARLARIRELVVQKGDAKMVEQVDQLIAKEKQLYERKIQRMQGQGRPGTTLPPLPGVGMKGKDKVDVNKPATPTPAAGTSPAAGQAVPTPAAPPAPATPAAPGGQPGGPKPR